MFEESHLGHLRFSEDELAAVAVAVVFVVDADVVEEEGDNEGEGEVVPSKIVPLMENFLSPPIRPAPPRSS